METSGKVHDQANAGDLMTLQEMAKVKIDSYDPEKTGEESEWQGE